MDKGVYEAVGRVLEDPRVTSISTLMEEDPVLRKSDVPQETLTAIWYLKTRRRMKVRLPKFRSPRTAVGVFLSWWGSRRVLAEIAEDESVALAHCLLARTLLTVYYLGLEGGVVAKTDVPGGEGSSKVEDPQWVESLAALVTRESMKAQRIRERVSRALRDPYSDQIGLPPEIGDQIDECVAADLHYSPLSDRIRRLMGLEYEYLLQEKVANVRMAYLSEQEMLQKGYAKTPDVRLQVPVLIKPPPILHPYVVSPPSASSGSSGSSGPSDPSGLGDGSPGSSSSSSHSVLPVPVNWIESKASFGDKLAIDQDVKQFRGYRDRMGPGAVIYWFGYVVQDAAPLLNEGILILSSFPPSSSIIQLPVDTPE